MQAFIVGLFLLLRLPSNAAVNIGLSLSFSGSYYTTTSSYLEMPVWGRPTNPPASSGVTLTTNRGCFFCDRVNQTLHAFLQRARDTTGLNIQLTVLDDEGIWTRCRTNYRALAADPSVDFLLGPGFEVWQSRVNKIAHDNGKLLLSWAGTFPYYLADFRTQLCPYCNTEWKEDTQWVSEVSEFATNAFQTSLIATARATGGRMDESPWVISTQPVLRDMVRPALSSAQQAVINQMALSAHQNVTWGFAYFPNSTRGSRNEAECVFFEGIVQTFGQVTTNLLPMALYVTDSFQPRRSFDVLVFCGTTNAFGQAMVKAQALNWRFQALITSFSSGTRSLFRYGGPFVNYLAEPLPCASVLPNATDAIIGSYDMLTADVGFEPDMASLQAASAASLLVQASLVAPSTSGTDVVNTLRSQDQTFETLFGTFGHDSSGNRLLQPFAFRQFIPSNIIPLQAAGVLLSPGEMNSNIVLVSPEIAEFCASDNSSVLCRDVVLSTMEFPMPGAAARYRQAYMCPDGTSLEGTACHPCERGFYRAGEMVSCEPCPPGKFADYPGAGVCEECPAVSLTCRPDSKPVFLPGFFVFEGEFAWLSTTGFEPIKLVGFAFLLSGFYLIEDPINQTRYSAEVTVLGGLTECSQLCEEADGGCIGFLFVIERSRCFFYREGAQYFPWFEINGTLLYLKESVYPTAPRPDNSTRRKYPQPPTDPQWAICPAPGACRGGTGCTDDLNHGLFCSQCVAGAATNGFFPSSRLCSLCPGTLMMIARILIITLVLLGLMMFLALKARSAKGTYARIALPAMKLLLSYSAVLGTLADSNQLMLQGTIWFILRIPLEMLLRPWYMMQIDCIPIVFQLPSENKTHGYLHHELVKNVDRNVAVSGVSIIVALSTVTLIFRLLHFCFSGKAKAASKVALGVTDDVATPYQSEGTNYKLSEMSTADNHSHSDDDDQVAHRVSRWTAFGEGVSASAKSHMARYRYLFMHEEFLLYREVSKVIRRITIFAFWFMPVYLRTQVVPLRCLELDHIHLSVMIEHPDIVCGSELHDELMTPMQFLWGVILYPAVWALVVLLSYRWKSEAATMEAVAFLNAGYKYGMYWWDVLMVFRTSFSFLLMAVPGRILRIMSQMALIALVSLLENSLRPWSRSNNGVLQRASNLLSAGLLLTAAVAAWEVQQRQNAANFILHVTASIITGMSICCSIGGILLLTLNVVFDELFAPLRVLLQNGAATGSWTRMFYVATAWLVGGLHELHLWRGDDGRWVMNHSQLSRLERNGLVMLLVDILEQCLTLRGQFRMRQVETVLLLAFQNAAQVRRGTVQNDFYTYGTVEHPLTIWGFPRVASQDPDISPNFDLKVTLTELQTALEMVSNDIQSGDPEVMTHTKVLTAQTDSMRSKADDHVVGEVQVWNDDFQDIEGKVINHRQSQLKEHEAAQNERIQKERRNNDHQQGIAHHDSQHQILRHLELLINEEVDILLQEFDELAQEHISFITNSLGARAQDIEQEIREGRAVADDTETWSEEPLPPFDRGDAAVNSLALRKAEAARKATLLTHEVREKADKTEACLQAYLDKAQESMHSSVAGASVKGKRLLLRDLNDAQAHFRDSLSQLKFQVQECKTLPALPPLGSSPKPEHKHTAAAAATGAVSEHGEDEELSDHGRLGYWFTLCNGNNNQEESASAV